MKNYGIILTLLGIVSLNVYLMLLGLVLSLLIYFSATIREEIIRRKRNRKLNGWLKNAGRMN